MSPTSHPNFAISRSHELIHKKLIQLTLNANPGGKNGKTDENPIENLVDSFRPWSHHQRYSNQWMVDKIAFICFKIHLRLLPFGKTLPHAETHFVVRLQVISACSRDFWHTIWYSHQTQGVCFWRKSPFFVKREVINSGGENRAWKVKTQQNILCCRSKSSTTTTKKKCHSNNYPTPKKIGNQALSRPLKVCNGSLFTGWCADRGVKLRPAVAAFLASLITWEKAGVKFPLQILISSRINGTKSPCLDCQWTTNEHTTVLTSAFKNKRIGEEL